MPAAWRDFRSGAADVLPVLPANVPFGLIVGVATVDAGLAPVEAMAMSALMFAGVAQLAAVDLLGQAAPAAVVVLTAVVVNLRYLMYSASIAPHFRALPARWRWLLAYFLVDVNYALAVDRYRDDPALSRRWYFLGTSAPLWTMWVGSIAVGVFLGARVPASWGLGFVVPLVFLALLARALETRAAVAAAAVAGAVATAGVGLPFDGGIVVGALAGVVVGLAVGGRP